MTAHFRNYIFAYASQLFPERRRLENMDKVFEFMEQVVAFGFSRGLVITKAARYSYKNGRTPMFTDCFTIDRIEPEAFSPMKHSIRFILTVLDEFLENLPRIARDPKSVKFRFGLETIRGDDEFSIYADGKRVGAIEMRTLFRDARYYLEHIASRSVEYGEHNRDSREEIKAESR